MIKIELNKQNSIIFYTKLHINFFIERQSFIKKLPQEILAIASNFVQEKDKMAFLMGRYLIERQLKKYVNGDLWEQIGVDSYGKPYLKSNNIYFNLSHSGEWVVLAISEKYKIGIDIEKIDTINYYNFENCFNSQEWKNIINSNNIIHKFYKYWTWKESIIKADGRGLSIELQDVFLGKQYSQIADKSSIFYSEFVNIADEYKLCVSWEKD